MQPEHEEHFGGPATEALDRRQPFHHFIVGQRVQLGELQPAIRDSFAQVAQIADFLTTQADASQRTIVERLDRRRTGNLAARKERDKPTENRRRRLGRELLAHDGADERREVIAALARGQRAGSDALDGGAENRIAPAQEPLSAFVVCRSHRLFHRRRKRHVRANLDEARLDAGDGRRFGAREPDLPGRREDVSARVFDPEDPIDAATGACGRRVGPSASVDDRGTNGVAFGGRTVAQVESDAVQRGCAGLYDKIRQFAGARHVVQPDLKSIVGNEVPECPVAVRFVELLIERQADRPQCVFDNTGLGDALLHRAHGVGVLPLRVAGISGARHHVEHDERDVRCTAHHGFATCDDDRHRCGRQREILRDNRPNEDDRQGEAGGDQAAHTILKPTLYAYVSGGTSCRYAHRSIARLSLTHDPPRTIRMLPDSGPRGSRTSLAA